MRNSKVIYIAGPYRGKDSWEVQENVHNAERAAYFIASKGYIPLCPHAMYRHFDGTMTDQYWIDGTLELMKRCDAVVVLPGYAVSEGTKGEIEEAKRRKIPVFFYSKQVSDIVLEDLDLYFSELDKQKENGSV